MSKPLPLSIAPSPLHPACVSSLYIPPPRSYCTTHGNSTTPPNTPIPSLFSLFNMLFLSSKLENLYHNIASSHTHTHKGTVTQPTFSPSPLLPNTLPPYTLRYSRYFYFICVADSFPHEKNERLRDNVEILERASACFLLSCRHS